MSPSRKERVSAVLDRLAAQIPNGELALATGALTFLELLDEELERLIAANRDATAHIEKLDRLSAERFAQLEAMRAKLAAMARVGERDAPTGRKDWTPRFCTFCGRRGSLSARILSPTPAPCCNACFKHLRKQGTTRES